MTDQPDRRAPRAHSERFIKRLEQLARQATLLKNDAVMLADRITNDLNLRNVLATLMHDAAKTEVLAVVIGDSSRDDNTTDAQAKLLWSSLTLTVARTNGGFALDDQKALQEIADAANRVQFWNFHHNKVTPHRPYARAYFLISLYASLVPRFGDATATGKLRDLKSRFSTLVADAFQACLEDTSLELATSLWQVALARLARTVLSGKDAAVLPIPPDEILQGQIKVLGDYIAVALQPGGDEKPPQTIADVLSVLCGRLLNPDLQLHPRQIKLFGAAVDLVLDSTKDGDDDTPNATLADPLGSLTPAIAYLLDLPNPILMERLPALARTAQRQLNAIQREVTDLLVTFPEGVEPRPYWPSELIERIFPAVYRGLVLGTSVAERFRDLLSELEVRELQVKTPANVVKWDDLSDSLGFKSELDNVIHLWKSRSKNRPGAILVFGPPGTGKTTIAEAFLRRLNEQLMSLPGAVREQAWQFIQLSPADFAREGADKVIASAEALFDRLQRLRRCVVLLDEMEEFLRSRGTRETERDSRLVTTAFLPLLQETVDRREIILIVATNYVGGIDSAITRRGRFDLILPLGPPDDMSREQIIRKEWPAMEPAPEQSQLEAIVTYTQGYTYGEILDFLSDVLKIEPQAGKTVSARLELKLWRIRQEKVPLALSGNPGCDWRKFQDEAMRFRRGVRGVIGSAAAPRHGGRRLSYWDEPTLPERQ